MQTSWHLRFVSKRSDWSGLASWGILQLGVRLRGRTATPRSKKGSEKVLERVLGKGSQKGF